MCGIAGVVGLPTPVARPRVAEALRRLQHRGPDGEGVYLGDAAVLGMRRLAIIDVACGHQPIFNEDESIAVVCNGELYNYVEGFHELTQRGHRLQSASDINLIPHFYEEAGRAAFIALRGMFAAAVWDSRERVLTLARDRAGKKPLFYARVGPGLAFASELPALLALLDRPPAHQPSAIADYLQLGFVPHPATIYEGVLALPPGCTLVFRPGGQPDIAPYWSPSEPEPFRGSRPAVLEQLDTRLREAVALRLRSDVPVGLFLSGGIDSGLIAAYARSLGARDLLCFVAEVPDRAMNEAPAARRVAQHLELPIHTIPVAMAAAETTERIPYLYGQPFGDFSAIPTYFVARAAAAHRKVVLNGDGGDEILGGYRRYWVSRAAPWLVPLSAPLRPLLRMAGARLARSRDRRSALGFASRTLRGLASRRDAERYLTWNVDLLSDADLARTFPDLARGRDGLTALARQRGEGVSARNLRAYMRSDYRLMLADGLLSKMDIATMANSLEARSPFLDVPLAEFAWSLPPRWLVASTRTKPLLRDLARAHLPRDIAVAPKRGFEVPMRQWLAHKLHDLVRDSLLGADSRVATLGNRAAIADLVTRRDHFAGNHDRVVWGLLMLELFLRAPTPRPA